MSDEQKDAKVFHVEPGIGRGFRAKTLRIGRGFSRSELEEAGSSITEARSFGIPIDTRRRSMHDFNVAYLKPLLEDERARVVKAELEKEVIDEKYTELMQVRGIGLTSAKTLVEMDVLTIEDLAALDVAKLETLPEDTPIKTIKRWIINAKKHLGEEIEEEVLEELEEDELEEIEEELGEIEEEELERIEEELDELDELDELEEAEPEQLEESELDELEADLEKLGEEIEEEVEEELTEAEKEEIYEELMQVSGIGPASAEKIVDLGITSIEELADLEVDMIPETVDTSTKTIRRWIKKAKKYLKEELEEKSEELTEEDFEDIEAELDELEDDVDLALLDEDMDE